MNKQLKELFLSEDEDDIRLAFILARKTGVTCRSIDLFLVKLNMNLRLHDEIADDYIITNPNWPSFRYKSWKDEQDNE